jgi:hypothetical protein
MRQSPDRRRAGRTKRAKRRAGLRGLAGAIGMDEPHVWRKIGIGASLRQGRPLRKAFTRWPPSRFDESWPVNQCSVFPTQTVSNAIDHGQRKRTPLHSAGVIGAKAITP